MNRPTIQVNEQQIRKRSSNYETKGDPTASYNEIEAFYSIWDALRWKHVRTRVPICFKKTLRSRYMLANLVYLGYTIGFLVADFGFPMNESTDTASGNDASNISDTFSTTTISILDQPAGDPPIVNKLYFSKFKMMSHRYLF